MSDWKPGDVAMVGADELVVFFRNNREGDATWFINGYGYQYPASNVSVTARPLVVIDPEDREAARVLALGYNTAPGSSGTDKMQAALREFANPKPPKPDEPMGLGAVVEDEDGKRWVRADEVTPDDFIVWHCTKNSGLDWRDWSAIAAVRVLSKGVQS